MLLKILTLATALAAPAFAHTGASPYAGEQARDIKALSDQDRAALQEGQGMGYAKAAELNGYPGPTHVLELARHLQLTREQEAATRKLLADHKEAARKLGAAVIEAERALDQAFAGRRADEATVRQLTADVARLQGELRFEHLKTHLAQAALLRREQLAHYANLRGYTGAGAGAGGAPQHRH
jgi:Spy/CpxP family protein refolding chaperone